MSNIVVPAANPAATAKLSIAEGLTVNITPDSARLVRSVTTVNGAVRVSFLPAASKSGPSLKGLGLKGQAAKACLRRAKREIGSAFVGAVFAAVSSGKLDWKAATLSKGGTLGIFFSEGDAADAAALSAAEEELAALKAELAALKAAKA